MDFNFRVMFPRGGPGLRKEKKEGRESQVVRHLEKNHQRVNSESQPGQASSHHIKRSQQSKTGRPTRAKVPIDGGQKLINALCPGVMFRKGFVLSTSREKKRGKRERRKLEAHGTPLRRHVSRGKNWEGTLLPPVSRGRLHREKLLGGK